MTSAADFTVVSSTPRFTGRVFSIRTDRLRMPDGTESDRDIVAHPGAVAVLALDEADRVVMVRQFRQPVGQLLDELPAGLLDVDGEPALIGARRELFEEAALRADTWHVLIDLYTSPGMTDEAIRIYLARGLSDVPAAERYVGFDEEATMTPAPGAARRGGVRRLRRADHQRGRRGRHPGRRDGSCGRLDRTATGGRPLAGPPGPGRPGGAGVIRL